MGGSTHTGKLDPYVSRVLRRHLVAAPDESALNLDGTLVFVDLSGFTRLSERLARRGKEGAEQLTEVINSCFSTLLADAYGNGGGLLKFGGDALLLWFDGERHAERACASAVAMRTRLRQVGRITTGSSQIVLRMSVGVHSGAHQMFLVGDSHREHLVGGPGPSTVVAMEAIASAGEILVSEQTAELLPRSCLGASRGPGVLLSRAPTPPFGAPPEEPVQPSDDAIATCLSTSLRAHLGAGPTVPEHRSATVAFLQFGRLDDLIADHSPDAAADALDELVRTAQDAADRYNVCVLGSDVAAGGGKLIFTSGAPRAVGEDEERMLLALRQIADATLRLPVRIGVNRGQVFAGEIGPYYRRTYTVMGDAVNLAARLMAAAPWGAIYSTAGVLERSDTRFQTAAVASFTVKGKIRPIQAWHLGPAQRSAPPGTGSKRLPLIGRERELGAIQAAVSGARDGRGSLVELVGETGSGKSRLLTEARELAPDMRRVQATCETYTHDVPYASWRDPLRQLLELSWDADAEVVLGRLHSDLAASQPELLAWLPLLAIPLGAEASSTREVEELAPDFRAGKLQEVVLRLLAPALAVPTLVQIEHAHLMDEASAALLGSLVDALESSSWVVIVTRRDLEGGFVPAEGSAVRLELGPLSPDAALALAEATPEAHALPPHLLRLAVERSGGSPEFLLDLISAAAGGSGELPDSVEAAASARIDALDPSDRALVRRAAVLGLAFHRERLRHVLEVGASELEEPTWERLSGVFAFDPDGRVRFKRPALCEVAYESLPFRIRRELHAAVARALEPDFERDVDADPAVLSLHFIRAGDHERAWKYALIGAERASAQYAHADAAQLYRRAIEAGRQGGATAGELAASWEALGEALQLSGQLAAANEAVSAARRLVGEDRFAQARLFLQHATIARRAGRLTAAVRWGSRGLRALDGAQDTHARALRARLLAALSYVRQRQARLAEAERLCRTATTEAEAVGELRALAFASYMLDLVLVEQGHEDDAVHSGRALEIYERLGDLEQQGNVLNNLAMFAYFRDRWDEALELFERAADCAERAGNAADAATTRSNIGEILSDRGRYDEAANHLRRAQQVSSATGERTVAANATALLGRLAVRAGDYEAGLKSLTLASDELRRLGERGYAEFTQCLLAEAEATGGDARGALGHADRLLASATRFLPLVHRVRGIALVRLGDLAGGIQELEVSVTAASERGARYDLACALDLLETVGGSDHDRARERDAILAELRIEQLPKPRLTVPSGRRREARSTVAA